MRIVRGGHSWQLDSIASLAGETMGDSSSSLARPNMALEAISECLIKKISWGSLPPDPPSLYTLKAYTHPSSQWPYQS